MSSPQVNLFCVVEICDAKGNPEWDSPFVLVPSSFFKPQATGGTVVKYPSPPFSPDEAASLKDFVQQHAIPPPCWGEKRCKIENIAATYQLGVELLGTIRATRKVPKKRKPSVKKQDKTLIPLSKVVTKMKKTDQGASVTVFAPALNHPQPSLPQSQIKEGSILSDISNVDSSADNLHSSISDGEGQSITIDTEEQLSISAMKEMLFTIPFAPSGHTEPGMQSSSQIDEIVNVPLASSGENGFDFQNQNIISDSQETLSRNSSSQFSVQQSDINNENISQVPQRVEYVVMRKDQLLEFRDMIVDTVVDKLPPIVVKAVENKVNPRFDRIEANLKEVKVIVRDQSPQKKDILTFDELCSIHNLDLPLRTLDQFLKFDNLIKANKQEIKSDLKKFVKTTTSHETDCIDNVKDLVRRFVSNEILCQYTSQKPKKDPITKKTKPIFKSTAFCSSVFDSFLHVYTVDGKQKITPKVFFKSIGTVINIAHGLVAKSDPTAANSYLSEDDSSSDEDNNTPP